MNYYIDFDCTLYDTEKLIDELIEKFATLLGKNNYSETYKYLTNEFKINRVHDIYEFCNILAEKYKINATTLVDLINSTLCDGKKFVYPDAIAFLKSIKPNKINILTFSANPSTKYQKLKISGSGLEEFFDEIIITDKSKADQNIDYADSVFIDDSPKVIAELYEKRPLKIIRINRENSTYSKIKLPENIIVSEVNSLTDII